MARPRMLWINQFAVVPAQGGGTRHFELSRELVRRGWDVTVAASDFDLQTRRFVRRASAEDRTPIAEMVDGVRFVWLWSAPYARNDWRRGVNWLSFAWGVRRWAREEAAFDVVIGSSPHLFAAAAGESVARRMGAPFVFEVRDLWPESLVAAGGGKGALYLLMRILADRLYARADRVIVLARGSGDHLIARGVVDARKIAYIPNGVDTAMMARTDRAPEHSDRFTLVYAGAHGPANGLDAVLGAAELLRGDGVRFVLIGDGPAKRELARAAKARALDHVEFRDPVPKNRIGEVFAESDAGLMVLLPAPLFAFGVSPNKLFDYMGASLPVVCNVPGEVATMLREARAGVQAPDATAEGLATAIRAMRGLDRDQRRCMGTAGREWVEREHSRQKLAGRLDALLRDISSSR